MQGLHKFLKIRFGTEPSGRLPTISPGIDRIFANRQQPLYARTGHPTGTEKLLKKAIHQVSSIYYQLELNFICKK
jgi:hypothetical protein